MIIKYTKRFDIKYILMMYMLLVCTLAVSGQALKNKYTLHINNVSFEKFVKQIEELTGYSFIYGEELDIPAAITVNAKEKTLTEILDAAFNKSAVKYEIKNKHIILQKKKSAAVRKFTISGYIKDESSVETLIGANIVDRYNGRGTTTNPYGYYSITLPEGDVAMTYSYLGYATQLHNLSLNKDTILNVHMNNDNQLEEVVIISDKTESGIMSTHMSATDIDLAHIKGTPTVLGETDVLKTIQMLPGVQAGIEGSAGIYVRGGSPDQNLFLLDGVPVYNVDHMFGFFSIFTPEAVKKVTMFKGSFPARFGGRLSSVVDIRTNDGDMKNYHGV